MIVFHCTNKDCGEPVRVAKEHVGKKGRCPHCKSVQIIPKQGNYSSDSAAGIPLSPQAESESLALEQPLAQAPSVSADIRPTVQGGVAQMGKSYRQYQAADAGKSRGVSVKLK